MISGRHRARRDGRTSCLDKRLGHEHIEVGGGVFAERTAPLEPIASIQRMRRLESRARAGLEEQARVSALMAGADDLIEDGLPDTSPKKGRTRAHRLDLSGELVEFLQSPAPAQEAVQPSGPERDAWCPKALDRERVHVTRRGVPVHASEMFGNERLDFCRGEVILTDGDTHDARSAAVTFEMNSIALANDFSMIR